MSGQEFNLYARDALSDAIRSNAVTVGTYLEISPWLATSLLQKAVRRGREELALNAAATLLRDHPARFWRRIGVIAFEDVGVADLSVVEIVIAALSGKSWRARFGSEWEVAGCLVSLMAKATKCRGADDLLMGVEHHPSLEQARREFATLPMHTLVKLVAREAELEKRALALSYALGTRNPAGLHGRGDPQVVFDELLAAGLPDIAVEVSREGFRKVREIICPFVSLLYPLRQRESAEIIHDEMPAETMFGNVPAWAFDMFVREGRRAINRFLGENNATARWILSHVPAGKRADFLGYILFAVEGGLLQSRLNWPVGCRLRSWAERESQGPWCLDAAEIIHLLRVDLPLLNEIRAQV